MSRSRGVNEMGIEKAPTGIRGLDEVTLGGLPRGRVTLLSGGPGSGKTVLGTEFLVNGARQHGEPGVFMAFEETAPELSENVSSLGFDLGELVDGGKLLVDHVYLERSEFEETGEFDLEGLFVRLGFAIDSIGARRVVLDTVETLFAGLPNEAVVRSELRRLFKFLKDRAVTAIVTGERGQEKITRYGLEEYVSDCVIVLDHRVEEQVTTRRLRVVKYRGSPHGTNEYPFLIGDKGVSVAPITSLRLEHAVSTDRVSSGVGMLDEMTGGLGFYRGSTVLVTGMAGTGKTSVSAAFAEAACERGERALFFAFEEAPDQIKRNMRSIGLDLQRCEDAGLLDIIAHRPMMSGLETHLAMLYEAIEPFDPTVVVLDPITNFTYVGTDAQITSMLARLIDFLKERGITAMLTSLLTGNEAHSGISSLTDTWVMLRSVGGDNGVSRLFMSVLKSRGMAHSGAVQEYRITDEGFRKQGSMAGAGEAR